MSLLPACAAVDDDATTVDDSLAETTSELSASNWTSPQIQDYSYVTYAPAMAVMDGVEYYVYAHGVDGAEDHVLQWKKCDATGCTPAQWITASDGTPQRSMSRVSLAAYNGHIYMVHQGDSDPNVLWWSRLEANGRWRDNAPFTSFTTGYGTPALAAFNGRLYMVGNHKKTETVGRFPHTTYPLWYATMTPDEAWSFEQPVAGAAAVTSPSMAVLDNKLYLAHVDGNVGEFVLQSLPAGGAWTAPAYIIASNTQTGHIGGNEVQIAAVNGYLHVAHQCGSATCWTYNRGCDAFVPEIGIDGQSSFALSLSTGRNGTLVLNRLYDSGGVPDDVWWVKNQYNAPPAPQTVPHCGAY